MPSQRGLRWASGRNTPIYTWFRLVPRTLIDTGSVVAANTLLTDWTSEKIVLSAFSMADRLVARKYLPCPATLLAMLWSRVAWAMSLLVLSHEARHTSIV